MQERRTVPGAHRVIQRRKSEIAQPIDGEEWRVIPLFEDYEVSSMGRVRRGKPARTSRVGTLIVGGRMKNGYLSVTLCRNGETVRKTVHRLVAAAFIGPAPQGLDVCHYDGVKTNNAAANLRYDTRSGNMADSKRMGKLTAMRGRFGALNNSAIAVEGISADGSVVHSFGAIIEAEQHGFQATNITKCIRGLRRTCGGLTWRVAGSVT